MKPRQRYHIAPLKLGAVVAAWFACGLFCSLIEESFLCKCPVWEGRLQADNNRNRKRNTLQRSPEKALELIIELAAKVLLWANHEGGFLDPLYHIRHSKGLARSVTPAGLMPEPLDKCRLPRSSIACGWSPVGL